MQRENTRKEMKKRANVEQFIPYLSADAKEHMPVYLTMERIFAPVFDWIGEEVSESLRHFISIQGVDNVPLGETYSASRVQHFAVARRHPPQQCESGRLPVPIHCHQSERSHLGPP